MIDLPVSIREKTNAALKGDTVAMGTLFEWFRPRLYAHALRICGNTPLAQDAVQDTFIAAYTHLASVKNEQHFYPWLKKILVHTCFRLKRRENSVSLSPRETSHQELLYDSINKHFENLSNQQSLYNALKFLSEELRSCVLLRYFSSMSNYEDIAMVLDIPVGTVRSRLAAARQKLTTLFFKVEDSGDEALKESNQWSDFYKQKWLHMYDDLQTRNELFEHHHPDIFVRFTSGKWSNGRSLLEYEINEDLHFGTRFLVNEVASSGNISVIEGPNHNFAESPDRCAPSTVMVVFRENGVIQTIHIFDAPRS